MYSLHALLYYEALFDVSQVADVALLISHFLNLWGALFLLGCNRESITRLVGSQIQVVIFSKEVQCHGSSLYYSAIKHFKLNLPAFVSIVF